MVVADLHVHTTNSDGTFELDEVPAAAAAADLDAVAITDHDRLHPDLDAPVVERDGVTLIHGIELRVDAGAQRVDLLGYGARETDALADEIERLQRDRIARGRAMIERVEDRLGVSLPVEPERGLGRPDIARAVVDAHDDYDALDAVFADLIGNDGPCYVARDVPSFERGREILADACALVGLAHPLRYGDPEHALSLAPDLDALEVRYPYDADVDRGPAARVAESHDLLVTGGSDAHDRTLAREGLAADGYRAVADALELA